MGFFYTKEKSQTPITKEKKKHFLDIGYEQGCKVCPLNRSNILSSPKMDPTGTGAPIIYVLGEAPGETEDEEGIQFIGKSGELLRDTLEAVFEIDLNSIIRWNNCVRCRPTNKSKSGYSNRTPTELEILCCKKSVIADIEKTKPDVILGFGNIPLKWLIGEEGVQVWRGHKVPVKVGNHTCWYFPMLHPSFINRKEHSEEDWETFFERDIRAVKDFLEEENRPVPEVITKDYKEGIEFVLGNSIKDLETIQEALDYFAQFPTVALDIETVGLRPYDQGPILCIAIGTDEEVFVFPIDHPKAWNFTNRRDKIVAQVYEKLKNFILTSGTKVCHNLKFEIEWFNYFFGPDVIYQTNWGDTQAQAVIINEVSSKQTKMHSLDIVCLRLFGFNLKALSSVDRNNPLKAPLKDLLLYNGMDTKYTYKAHIKFLPYAPATGLYNHLNTTAGTLALVQNKKELYLNKVRAAHFKKKLDNQINDVLKEIQKVEEVKTFKELLRTDFNPKSPDHLVMLFKDIYKLPAIKLTSNKKYSTDHEVLETFAEQGVKVAQQIVSFRELAKLNSTYVEPAVKGSWYCKDGYVHSNFNHLFATTGRLTSSDPVNWQNFPNKKGVWIREMVVPPKGCTFVAFDQGQIEARVISMASGDPVFSEAIKNDYDVHREWAIKIIKLYPAVIDVTSFKQATDKQIKTFRSITKNKLVFPWFYKAGKFSVGRSLGLPEEITDELYEDFWDTFKGVKAWQERTQKFYEKNGYVLSLTGRKRHGPLSPSEIVNSPIQGTASDIVVDSGNRLAKIAYEKKDPILIYLLNIHDDLTFCVPDDMLDYYIPIIAKEMVRPCYDFMNGIPLSVEVKVGKSWGEMEEVMVYNTRDFYQEAA